MMDKDNNDSDCNSPSSLNKSDNEKSFVGKFKSHVSGIINNTPLSKWFRKNEDKGVRRRDEDNDDELFQMQPPLKRAKLPSADKESCVFNNHFSENLSSTPIGNSTVITKSSLNSFPQPVAGPSGIKSRKLLTSTLTSSVRKPFNTSELLNGHKDSDSEESTSGYSSVARISSKEQVFESRESSKQTSPLENSPTNSRSLFNKNNTNMSRSLFGENSLSPHLNRSLSSTRPSFNASTFGSPNFVDKTLSTKRIINSPFYHGRTTYGGASAYGRRLGRTAKDLQQQVAKNSVQIKPVNKAKENHVALGKTAQRILNTLEQYSSPVNDAKKIPMASKKLRADSGILTKYTGVNPYLLSRESKVASNSELQVPTVSDLLKMKQSKARLQESTESVRQLATSSKSSLNKDSYTLSTKESDKPQHSSKIRGRISSVRPRLQKDETVPEIHLVSVPLPITTLPKIDLQIAPPPAVKKSPPKYVEKEQEKPKEPSFSYFYKPPAQTENKPTNSTEYTFSNPLILNTSNIKSLVAINDYSFREPVSKKARTDSTATPALTFNMPDFKPTMPMPKLKNNGDSTVKIATELKTTGSVMDILGKNTSSITEKFKPAVGTWECSTCLIRNQPEKTKCVACETPKAGKSEPMSFKPKTEIKPFEMLKPASSTWECDTCLIRNKSELTKCAACETPKPGSTTSKPASFDSGFGSQFSQKNSGTWECDTCMVRNKNDVNKCVACEGSKPGSKHASAPMPNIPNLFGDKFKMKNDEWECGVCMVKNKSSNTKCQCCETPNPKQASSGVKSLQTDTKPISSFNFGIDKNTAQSFNFGIPTSAKVETPKLLVPAASVFGEAAKTPSAAPPAEGFSFGLPAQDKPKEPENPKETAAPILAAKPAEPEKPKVEAAPTFKFGAPASIPEAKKSETKPPPTFEFKAATTTAANGDLNKTPATNMLFGTKTDSTAPTFGLSASPAAPTFSFGKAKPAETSAPKPAESEAKKPMFQFGASSAATSQPAVAAAPAPSSSLFGGPPAKVSNGFGSSAPAFNSSTPSFGAPSAPSTETKPFSFGGAPSAAVAPNTEAPKSALFSFGQAAADPKPTTGGFGFGAPAAPAAGAFSFSAAPKPEAVAPPSTGIFGAAAAAASAAMKNGGASFNFGASAPNNNNAQKAGFSFGAASTPAPSTGFNFGAAASAAPSAGGFNFSAQAAPAFDANAKPSFNFTDGQQVVGFSAPPSDGGGMGQRKIKKAVRRSHR